MLHNENELIFRHNFIRKFEPSSAMPRNFFDFLRPDFSVLAEDQPHLLMIEIKEQNKQQVISCVLTNLLVIMDI